MNFLEEILSVKKDEVAILRRDRSLSQFRDSKFFNRPKISLAVHLSNENKLSIIAEIKKASPSKGIIREDFNPEKIAEDYHKAGADAISILTDERFFQGSLNYLSSIAEFTELPLLRKDFIIDEFQIFEAKSHGADAVLLICECLSKSQLQELTHCAMETNLEVLLELHNVDQITKIDFSLNKIIGVNNRNLETFETDLHISAKVKELIPKENILVSESGIRTEEDIEFVREIGAEAVLVGEHFMRQKSVYDAVSQFTEWCNNAD